MLVFILLIAPVILSLTIYWVALSRENALKRQINHVEDEEERYYRHF